MIDVDDFCIREKTRTATVPEVAVSNNERINARTLLRRTSTWPWSRFWNALRFWRRGKAQSKILVKEQKHHGMLLIAGFKPINKKRLREKALFEQSRRPESLSWQGVACHRINACISFSLVQLEMWKMSMFEKNTMGHLVFDSAYEKNRP